MFSTSTFIEDGMVTVKNSQRKIPIDKNSIVDSCKRIMKILDIEDYKVDVWFCSEQKIREFNGEWSGALCTG